MTSEHWRAKSSLLACLVLLFSFAFVRPVFAEETAEYKELIDQALSEFRHKNWPEARVLFRRAHEISPNARTSRGMGVVSYEMRDYVQAVRDLTVALADTRQPLTEQQRAECQTLLARSRTFVGTYDLVVTPADAHVTIDGATPTREPDGSLLLAFGEHELRASVPGHEDLNQRLTVQGGEHTELEVRLVPSVVASPVAVTPAVVETPRAPSEAVAPPPPRAEPTGIRGSGLKYTWVALSASVLFGGGAGLAWYLGEEELKELDQRCAARAAEGNPCQRGKTNTDKVTRYERMTNAGLGVSAAAFVTAVILMGIEWPRERQITVGLSPSSLTVRKEF